MSKIPICPVPVVLALMVVTAELVVRWIVSERAADQRDAGDERHGDLSGDGAGVEWIRKPAGVPGSRLIDGDRDGRGLVSAPSLAVSRSTYVPVALNVAAVAAWAGSSNTTAAGPVCIDHAIVRELFGRPSSVTEPYEDGLDSAA